MKLRTATWLGIVFLSVWLLTSCGQQPSPVGGHSTESNTASVTASVTTSDPTTLDSGGGTVTFTGSASGGDGNYTYTWSADDGSGASVSSDLSLTSGASVTLTAPANGTRSDQSYTITLTASDGSGHSNNATATVTVQASNSFVVAGAGDIACDPTSSIFNNTNGSSGSCHMRATSDLLLNINPDAVLPLGDEQYDNATLSDFQQSYDPTWGRVKALSFPAIGNHEYYDHAGGASGYFSYFGSAAGDPSKGYYSFDLGAWHLVALNSNCSKAGGCDAGSPQEVWLRNDLAAHPTQCTLAYWHHPRYASGYTIRDKVGMSDLWQALMDYGAEIVLSGHAHLYERFAPQDANANYDPNGIVQFVVGSGGKGHDSFGALQPNSLAQNNGGYGVIKLTLAPTSYSWEFVADTTGTSKPYTDTGSASCH